jgi:hypothetical protein
VDENPINHLGTPQPDCWLENRLTGLREPTRRERLQTETELFGYAVSGHPLELFADVAWATYCPVSHHLHQTLSRMLWLALNPSRACTELPTGWARGEVARTVAIDCRESAQEVAAVLAQFFWQSSDEFLLWLGTRFCERTHPFERGVIDSEMEILKAFSAKQNRKLKVSPQLALL